MPFCGSQVILCDVPVHFDTYVGCSHGCEYCFANKKQGQRQIKPYNALKKLENFINGKRYAETCWCDWDIPLHWGALSDPFQPAEKEHGISMKALRVFAEYFYPFICTQCRLFHGCLRTRRAGTSRWLLYVRRYRPRCMRWRRQCDYLPG